MWFDVGPCNPEESTLDIINAIFNGFQTLAIMVLSHFVRQSNNGGAPRLPLRRKHYDP